MNYLITGLNTDLEIINPTIEIVGLADGNPKITNIDFPTKKYNIDIILMTENARFGMNLTNVQAVSLDWASGQDLPLQVLTALNEQFAV